jgi:hypothetical protein
MEGLLASLRFARREPSLSSDRYEWIEQPRFFLRCHSQGSVHPLKRISLVLLLFALSSVARADCTGSSPNWTTTIDQTSVQKCINGASDGDTITVSAGTATWSGVSLPNSYGVTLICATGLTCTVNTSGTAIGMQGTISETNTHFYRISGFTFNESSANLMMWFYGAGTLSQIRIDHNTMGGPSGSQLVFFGEERTLGHYYGVLDHNTINCSNSCNFIEIVGATDNSPPTDFLGTGNAMFLENNTMTVTTMDNAGSGCTDAWGGDAALVVRYNTFTNCLVTVHGETHNGGPTIVEVYHNNLIQNSGSQVQNCYRCFHHQGSALFLAWSNRFTGVSGQGHSGAALDMAEYRAYANGPSSDGNMWPCDGTQTEDGNRSPAGSNYGYPCWRQPGRDAFGNYKPMYTWDNAWTDDGSQVPFNFDDFGGVAANGSFPPSNCTYYNGSNGSTANCDYFTFHMQLNREGYDAVSASAQTSSSSPFNGATGMGFGALANRPTTCTNNSQGGAGVGYFATDVGSQGTLYTCSARNTWTAYYTPYTYPHPLQVNGGEPLPPQGLQAVVD